MKHIDLKTILRMDSFIHRKNTGKPEMFAEKIELSRSTFFEYLAYMRNDLTLNIKYDKYKETYFYDGANLFSLFNEKHQSSTY